MHIQLLLLLQGVSFSLTGCFLVYHGCITWVRLMSYLDWEKTSLFGINKSSTRLCSSGLKLALHLSMVSLKTDISGCWVLKPQSLSMGKPNSCGQKERQLYSSLHRLSKAKPSYGEGFIPFAPHWWFPWRVKRKFLIMHVSHWRPARTYYMRCSNVAPAHDKPKSILLNWKRPPEVTKAVVCASCRSTEHW
jgi:hypothetical protein